MTSVADFLSAGSARDKVVTAAEAIQLIRDGDTVAIEGFGGQCFPEELTIALETRFLSSGSPRNLGLVFANAQGDRRGRGLDRICHEGVLSRAIGGHWGMSPAIQKLAVENKIAGHNLPQGVLSQLEPAVEAVVVTTRLNRPPMNVLSDRLQGGLADGSAASRPMPRCGR